MTLIRLLRLCLLILSIAGPVAAQNAVPDHRYLPAKDTDFYGADLQQLFDTTQEACARACSAQGACVAYTFNTLSGACFPKSAITDRQPFVGAMSARKLPTDPVVLGWQDARMADLNFLTDRDLSAAHALVASNAQRFSFDQETEAELVASLLAAEQSGDTRNALSWAGKAVAATDRGDLWARYAYRALKLSGEVTRGDAQRRYRRAALHAAINAYIRTGIDAVKADALDTMAQALEADRRGRSAIPALRLAATFSPRADLTAALDQAIGKYGFRVVDTVVENDAAAPRVCAVFSERLVQTGVDYTPFVRVAQRGLVVQASDSQLCLDGVEHGKRYDITLRAGLPSASGEVLHKDAAVQLYVRDRTPLVRFPGRAYVLPRSADAALPVETVNVDVIDLTLRRVSDRNLVSAIRESYFGVPLGKYREDRFASTMAAEIWTGQGEVQNTLNTDMTTRLPMGEALADQPAGIYALSASVPGQDPYDNPAAMQWFVLSDLGLSTRAGVDGMQVDVRRLGDATAAQGITLSLISRANAVLSTAVTDADGFAQFPAGLTRGTGSAQPALLMAEDGTQDVAFLPLTDPAFDLSDRGVEGHPPAPSVDTFLTTDRGAYRVGEVIHATALLRDETAHAITGLPVTAILSRPDGVEYARHLSQNAKAGGHVFALPLGAEVPRGAWRIDIKSDVDAAPLASQTVLVEDFLPERLDFTLSLPEAPLRLRDTPPLTVAVDYLFGAPGSDLGVSGDLRLRAVRRLAGWDGFQFGRHDRPFRTRTKTLDRVTTDAAGRAVMPLALPALTEPAGTPLEADITLRVRETSGRPVERNLRKAITPDAPLIGIKPAFTDVLPEGAEARFDLIAVGPEGKATPMPVRWTINKVETRYQWYRLSGNWQWEPTTRRTRVATGEALLGEVPTPIGVPTDWGAYEVIVERDDGSYTASSLAFSSGWYGGDGATDTPDRLQMSLDAQSYDVGDTARLRLVADGDGVALISVLSNRVVARQVVEVSKGENLIPLEVSEGWGSGAYVTASVLRGMNVAAGEGPSRALGLVHAAVRPAQKALTVSMDVPDVVDGQAGTFRAALKVAGVQEGETAYVTLAAVDVGVLNLTGFEAPDVTDHYFGQRRLGVELRDIYGRLIDGLNGAMGAVRSGGDAAAAAQIQSPPPTEQLMAFFSGPITIGADGTAVVEIAKPAFNGTVKLMAVAWSDTGVGDTSANVIARDPVVIAASLPRFLAPADRARMLLELVHADGPAGEMGLEVKAQDGVVLEGVPASVTLPQDGSLRLDIPVTARAVGDHRITVVLRTPDGRTLRKELTLPVRDNDPQTAITRQFALGAGETFTFDSNVLTGLRQDTASATLTAGPMARFDVPGLLHQLDRYPHGCTEQVTSGALPLLYLGGLAGQAGLGAPQDIDDKIGRAIAQVLTRQSSNGAFGLWRAGSGEFWLDAYVTDFLARARAAGHSVPDLAFSIAMDNLRNRVNFAADFDRGGEDIAYALLVLAREGAANMGDLRYYADTKRDAFATPLAAAQLGAALAAYGDSVRADMMFARAAVLLGQAHNQTGWRSDFGTHLRDTAAVLRLSTEAGSTAIDPAILIAGMHATTKRLSTQEAAQITMAAHALSSDTFATGLEVNGQPVQGPVVQRLSGRNPQSATLTNMTDAAMDVTLTTFGISEVAPDAGGYGYAITREFYTMEGGPVVGDVPSGTRMVVVLGVTPFEEVGARLIVNDPLPAGFEIDNPNLLRSGQIGALDWLKTADTQNTEFRSDRFVAAVDHRSAEPFNLAYVVRAVTPGNYHHPAATVEDMYRAEYRANTATGRVTVLP